MRAREEAFRKKLAEDTMELLDMTEKAELRRFLAFKEKLYRGDAGYVSTDLFVEKDLLYKKTDFAKRCLIRPIAAAENGSIAAQAVLIFNEALPYVQLAYFEALPDRPRAVRLLTDEALRLAEKTGAEGVVAGLCGHISYGVGILAQGFGRKISFDSPYNKPYYADYFAGFEKRTLSSYRCPIADAEKRFPCLRHGGVRVRRCSMRNFREETERMRALCEATIAHTHLYFATRPLHYYQLIKDLKPFLRPENLLFAESENGRPLGFLLWHPDFNQMLAAGKKQSAAAIAVAWLFRKRRIDTAKVNAMGSLSAAATYALLEAFRACVATRYEYAETNFVWDCNERSSKLMRRFFGSCDRKYEVYYIR